MSDFKSEIGLVKADRYAKSLVLITLIVCVSAVALVSVMYFSAESRIKEMEGVVVLVDGEGNVSSGKLTEFSIHEKNKMVAKNVLKIGVDYMFGFSPNNYDARIEQGRAFFGNSGNEILQGYLNDNVKNKVVQNKLRVDAVIQEIEVGYNDSGLVGRVVFEQSFINGSAITIRTVYATCTFKEEKLSNSNSFGMVIEDWIIEKIENQ